jgi:hypothetical protein
MFAVQHPQHMGYRTLHSERNAVYPGRQQLPELRGADGFRVRLDRHFGVFVQAEGGVDVPQNAADFGRGQQGGRAAAEEDGADLHPARQYLRGQAYLGFQQARVGGLARAAPEFGRRVGVEIAISAADPAERDVYVNAERGIPEIPSGRGRQGAILGNRLTVRQGSWHAAEDKLLLAAHARAGGSW